jgi:hypothetical protein
MTNLPNIPLVCFIAAAACAIAGLVAGWSSAKLRLRRAEDKANQLSSEVRALLACGHMDSDQLKDIARIKTEHTQMFYTLRKIGAFIGENYRVEIRDGRHAGREDADVIIGYLQKERKYTQDDANRR